MQDRDVGVGGLTGDGGLGDAPIRQLHPDGIRAREADDHRLRQETQDGSRVAQLKSLLCLAGAATQSVYNAPAILYGKHYSHRGLREDLSTLGRNNRMNDQVDHSRRRLLTAAT